MAVSINYRAFVLEQLSRVLSDVRARNMFGGVGLYSHDLFFALIDNDTLYFKVDDVTCTRYRSIGMQPFHPFGEAGNAMSYFEVPAEVIEDYDGLSDWSSQAVAVARRARGRRARPTPSRLSAALSQHQSQG